MKIKKVGKINPVAKYSRNKSGAGAHKDKSKYDRKKERHVNMLGEDWDMLPDPEVFDKHIEEQRRLEESVSSKLDRLVLLQNMQDNCSNPNIWFSYEEEIMKIKEELEDVDF
tara:strand:- start:129 stop:464 length:336 start_codon:yes stop_codon:yes gene_type:complete